jgi:hypothetical protein
MRKWVARELMMHPTQSPLYDRAGPRRHTAMSALPNSGRCQADRRAWVVERLDVRRHPPEPSHRGAASEPLMLAVTASAAFGVGLGHLTPCSLPGVDESAISNGTTDFLELFTLSELESLAAMA